jgi:hypothetical protein
MFSKLQSAKQSKKFFWLNSPCHFRLRRASPTAVVKAVLSMISGKFQNAEKLPKLLKIQNEGPAALGSFGKEAVQAAE